MSRSKLTGECRLDLTSPATADDLKGLLDELDALQIDRAEITITLQPAVAHQGGWRDPLSTPSTGGMQLVATWNA